MKRYSNGMKSTEFTSKEINDLASKINIEKWLFNHLQSLAKYYGYDDSKSVEREEAEILNILRTENTVEAQKALGRYAERTITAYGLKRSELDSTIAGQEAELTEEEAEKKILDRYPSCSIEFTEEGCNFKFDNKKNAKIYTYRVNNRVELAKKLRVA